MKFYLIYTQNGMNYIAVQKGPGRSIYNASRENQTQVIKWKALLGADGSKVTCGFTLFRGQPFLTFSLLPFSNLKLSF